jgi:tetratricopeptide (TPR) repeat protein
MLLRRSPRFLDAHLLMARLVRYRFSTSNDPALLDRGFAAVRAAKALDRDDPRVLTTELQIAIEAGQTSIAESLLAGYRRAVPGDVGVQVFEAKLAERDGRIDEALSSLKRAVARRSSRFHMEQLADLEYRTGRIREARADLERMIEAYPTDQFSFAKLAQLELLYGRIDRAHALFLGLIERYPETNSYRTNLGLTRMLLGNYAGAAADLRIAHERRPKSVAVLLNLADAEGLAGNTAVSHDVYRRTIGLVEASANAGRWDSRLRVAQCLAHVGRHEEALVAAREGIDAAPENSEALYMASLVYALTGSRDSALVLAGRALEKGMQPRWFSFPWFDGLKSDEGFRRRLDEATRASDSASTGRGRTTAAR